MNISEKIQINIIFIFYFLLFGCGVEDTAKFSSTKSEEKMKVITVIDSSPDQVLIRSLPEKATARVRYQATAVRNPLCHDYDFGGSVYNPIPTPFPRTSIKYYDETVEAYNHTSKSVTFRIIAETGICKYQPQYTYLRMDQENKFHVTSRMFSVVFKDVAPEPFNTSLCELKRETSFYCSDVEVAKESPVITIAIDWQ